MKKWYASKTIISTLVLAVALAKSLFGVELLSTDEINLLGANIETIVTGVISLIAVATALYGRITAKDKIGL